MPEPTRDENALELRRAGIPIPRIREQLGFETDADVEHVISEQLARPRPSETRLLGLDRLDRMLSKPWTKAVNGDVQAIDRVLKIIELQQRLAGTPDEQKRLTGAFERTVDELGLKRIDDAAIAAGRVYAQQIDAAIATGDSLVITKAMYLMPHFLNVLNQLGATPEARDEIVRVVAPPPTTDGPRDDKPARVDDFEKFRQERGLA